MNDYPVFQVLHYCIFNTIILVYIKYVKPFETPFQQNLEVFNECCIIGVSYHLFTFTEWVGDYKLQEQMGWSCITIVLFNVLVNMILIMWISGSAMWASFKKKRTLKKRKSFQLERLERLKKFPQPHLNNFWRPPDLSKRNKPKNVMEDIESKIQDLIEPEQEVPADSNIDKLMNISEEMA